MDYPTLLTLRTDVRRELDLFNEPGITDTEINQYLNDAIKIAEANIHTLYEDYFLAWVYLPLVQGTATYDLPADVYAMKLRPLIYNDGTTIYQIRRPKSKRLFQELAYSGLNGNTDYYTYMLVNNAGAKPKINLFPPSRETSSTNVKVWYLRHANILTVDADLCDIPEWSAFIKAYAKNQIAVNKPGLANKADTQPVVDALFEQMVATLSEKVPDSDDELVMDGDFYLEHA